MKKFRTFSYLRIPFRFLTLPYFYQNTEDKKVISTKNKQSRDFKKIIYNNYQFTRLLLYLCIGFVL